MNNLITDSIRVSNQWLVGISGLISSLNYYRMGRLVLPLGVCLAIGGVGGSWLIPELTAGKISLKDYIGFFGLIVFVLGFFLIYEMTPKGSAGKNRPKPQPRTLKSSQRKSDTSEQGVKVIEGSWDFHVGGRGTGGAVRLVDQPDSCSQVGRLYSGADGLGHGL